MALTVAELNARLTADARQFNRTIGQAQRRATDAFASIEQAGRRMRGIGRSLSIGVTLPLVAMGTVAFKAASDLTESQNAVQVAFRESAGEVQRWAEQLSSAFGFTQKAALDAASGFRLVTQASDLTAGQMTRLAERAADLGSVFNVETTEAARALRSALVGEFEPARRLGVVMNQASIEARAVALGLKSVGGELTPAAKQAAVYAEIMEQTSFAQGDAVKTGGEAAGQIRQLKAEFGDVAAELGQALIPMFLKVSGILREIIDRFNSLSTSQQQTIVQIAAVTAVMGPAVFIVGALTSAVGALGSALLFLVTNPIGLVITAIALQAAAFVALVNNVDGFKEAFVRTFELIGRGLGEFVGFFLRSIDVILRGLANVAEVAAQVPGPTRDAMESLASALRGGQRTVDSWADNVADRFAGFARNSAQFVVDGAEKAGDAFSAIKDLIGAFNADVDTVEDSMEDFSGAAGVAADTTMELGENAETATDQLSGLEQTVGNLTHLLDQLSGAELDLENATDDVTRSQERLASINERINELMQPATQEELAIAAEDVERAHIGVARAQMRVKDTGEALQEALQGTKRDMEAVDKAKRGILSAFIGRIEASKELEGTLRDQDATQQDVTKAGGKLLGAIDKQTKAEDAHSKALDQTIRDEEEIERARLDHREAVLNLNRANRTLNETQEDQLALANRHKTITPEIKGLIEDRREEEVRLAEALERQSTAQALINEAVGQIQGQKGQITVEVFAELAPGQREQLRGIFGDSWFQGLEAARGAIENSLKGANKTGFEGGIGRAGPSLAGGIGHAAFTGVNAASGAISNEFHKAIKAALNRPLHEGAPIQIIDGGIVRARQHGGPVQGGRPFLVGEAGPELFVPGRSGGIMPNGEFGGTTIVVNVGGSVITDRGLESVVVDAIARARRNGDLN